jgi:hypothetical protein
MDMICTVVIISTYQVLIPICIMYSGYDGGRRRMVQREHELDRVAVRIDKLGLSCAKLSSSWVS